MTQIENFLRDDAFCMHCGQWPSVKLLGQCEHYSELAGRPVYEVRCDRCGGIDRITFIGGKAFHESRIRNRIVEPEWQRASGLCICEQCGRQYYDHPPHAMFPFLKVTCDGRVWKL